MSSHAVWIDMMIDTRPGFFPEVWNLRNVTHLSTRDHVYDSIKMYGLSDKARREIDAWIDFIDDDVSLVATLPSPPKH